LKKYILTSETIKFDTTLQFDGALWILESENDQLGFDRTTLLTIIDETNEPINIRIDWYNQSSTDIDFSVLLISETDKLFFGARFFWGIIDLKNVETKRQESCTVFWNFKIYSNTIVVISEFSAESMSTNGETIDKVPIDPPFDSKVFDDKIEFISPVFGLQTLKLKK
jgi:hypothetical protein